jgi:hemoglobin/transferrin/lactoferrin receptor protein
VPNPNLRPETSQTIEGGLRYVDDRFSLSGTIFTGQYKDFIDQVQVGGTFTALDPAIYQFINQGSVLINGAEFKGEAQLGDGFDAVVAASYAHGSSKNAGVRRPLDSIDPVKLVAGLGYRDAAGIWGGRITVTHSDGKQADRVSSTLCTPSCYRAGAFNIVDATGFWNINEHFTARVGVFNLFDKKYSWWSDVRGLASTSTVIDAYTQPGRNFGISLTARL